MTLLPYPPKTSMSGTLIYVPLSSPPPSLLPDL